MMKSVTETIKVDHGADWISVALAAADQAGTSVVTQDKIRQLLEGLIPNKQSLTCDCCHQEYSTATEGKDGLCVACIEKGRK